MKNFILPILIVLGLLNGLSAQNIPDTTYIGNPVMTKSFLIHAGIFIPTKSVRFRVNGSTENKEIDFDETFEFNANETTPNFNFTWFFTKRWQVSSEFFSVNTAKKAVLEEDINFGDVTFNAGSHVKAGYRVSLLRLFFGYTFVKNSKHQFGGGIGIHGMKLGPYIEGKVIINEDETLFKKVSTDALAPLPNIGLWYYFSPHPKWVLLSRTGLFYAKVGKYEGSLVDFYVGAGYQVFKNIGINAGYRFLNVGANVNNKIWNGNFNLQFRGPSISISGNF